MSDTASRTMELLGRLQGRRPRTADELATDLGVTSRTVRRDIARLRDLGYPVDTLRGPDGGYRLEAGAVLPPIFLTLDEAITTSLALQHQDDDDHDDLRRSSLAKIHASVPERIRWLTQAVAATTHTLVIDRVLRTDAHPVPVAVLGDLADACIRHVRIEVEYTDYHGATTQRRIEPDRIVNATRRWYLVGYDLDRTQWRTFRIDRMTSLRNTGTGSTPRRLPAADMDHWVTEQLGAGWQQVRAIVRAHAPAATVQHWIAPAWGTVVDETATTCLLHVGADSHDAIARWLLLLGTDITVVEPPELAHAFRRLAGRADLAARSGP